MIYTLTIKRNIGRVTVERVRVTLRAPDEATARVLARRFNGRRWEVLDCHEGAATDAIRVAE